MKISIILSVSLSLSELAFAQSPSNDYFPLAVGNQWKYNYYAYDWEQLGDSWLIDSGTATYLITSRSPSLDSTIWNCTETRDVLEHYTSPVGPGIIDTTYPVHDITSFPIIEYQAGNHRLVSWTINWKSVFYFRPEFADSNLLFRYYPSLSSDTSNLLLAQYQAGRVAQRFALALQRHTGLTKADYDAPGFTGYVPTTHHKLISVLLTSVQDGIPSGLPKECILLQNYPNPFNPTTNLPFVISVDSRLQITIYDVLGRLVQVIFNGPITPGKYTLHWDASELPTGVYICIARTKHVSSSIRLILLK